MSLRFSSLFYSFSGGIFILFALPLLLFPPEPVLAHESSHKHVLILHSYHPGYSWTDRVMEGMQGALAEGDKNLQWHVEYLDTNQYQDPEYFTFIIDTILHYKFKDRAFDLVLLSDNEALKFTLEHRDHLLPNTPIVFCGVNNIKQEVISGLKGITGVAEAPAFRETIELALQLHPKTEEIVVIGNTRNLKDRENRDLLLGALPEFEARVRFTLWDDLPVDKLNARLEGLSEGHLVFLNGSIIDQSGHVISPSPKSTKRMGLSCPVPLYSLWDSFLGQGIVGGKLVSATMQGRLAGKLALKVLHGENPEELPVITAGTNEFMFDYNELKRFGISLNSLPENSLIINKPLPFYALSERQLWGGLTFMTFLTGTLLFTLLGRTKAEKAYKESEAQVKLLLNSAAEGIYGLDLQGNCTFCNPAGLRLLGYKDINDLLGKNMHALTHHTRSDGTPYPNEECQICQSFLKDEGFHFEDEVFWRADGSSFPAEYWAYPLRRGEKPIGAVVSFLNITERKEAEDRLMEANRELDAFAYTVSHDLRTPLSVIIGFAEYLGQEYRQSLDGEGLEILSKIENQGKKMTTLMENLLSLAKVGKLERPGRPTDIDKVVDEVLTELGSQLTNAGATVKKGPLPELHVPETLLVQIFENLIGNAIRYAGKEGGRIEVYGARNGRWVRLYVRDHGPGIPAEERSRIFDVFYRGSTGNKVSGTGVGLATVQKIARLYGGRAWVEETPGGGSTFWVEMEDKG